MCTIVDPVARHAYKNAMIEAELSAGVVIKREPRDNKGGPRGGMSYANSSNAATPTA